MNHLHSSPTLARDLMNPDAVPLRPGKFEKDLALQFLSGQYSGWPVVDSTSKILGILTELRLLQAVSRTNSLDDLRVEDTMTTPVYVLAHEPIELVLNLMVQRQVLCMPVVANRNLVGVISRNQVLRHCFTKTSRGTAMDDSDAGNRYCPSCQQTFQPLRTPSGFPSPVESEGKAIRPCLLVVDDDSSVATMLGNVLHEWGYDVLLARNGREGLDVVGRCQIDGILLDMHMPVMDGRTMLDELRWLGYQMPVLMMSGGSDERTLRQLLQEGAQGFFMKPFHLTSLQQVCQQIFKTNTVKEQISPQSQVA